MSMSGPYVSHVTYEQMPAALVTDARGSPDDAAAARASRTHKHHTRPPGHTQRAGETKVEPARRTHQTLHRGNTTHRPVTRPKPQVAPSPSRHGEERQKTAGDLAQGSPNGVMNGAPNTPDSKRLERRGAKQPVFDAAEVCG